MKHSANLARITDRIRSDAHVSRLSSWKAEDPVLPLSNVPSRDGGTQPSRAKARGGGEKNNTDGAADNAAGALPPPAPPPESKEQARSSTSLDRKARPSIPVRIYRTVKGILFSSIFNVLLVFVPAGIAVYAAGVNPTVVFAVNAVAIVPLAGLLAHATESVAVSLGDALGALLNVTFGNAVELIIFIIALSKDEIRIVQASLVGSILANLLLILGMCFLFGGLRFREQIYNSTVTQMSACLLSLSVTSLVLPTAFHASFSDVNVANTRVLELSRGTSVILLLVYVLYLLFQLKSHAYLYESTPQHIIDEESHPGVLANMMNSSSDDSSTSSSDSDSSSNSRGTARAIKRAFRRRRKSSASSNKAPSLPSTESPTTGNFTESPIADKPSKHRGAILSGDEADADDEGKGNGGHRSRDIQFRDFENEKQSTGSGSKSPDKSAEKQSKRHRRRKHRKNKHSEKVDATSDNLPQVSASDHTRAVTDPVNGERSGARVAFGNNEEMSGPEDGTKRPFVPRTFSKRPTMPRLLASTVFSAQNYSGPSANGQPTQQQAGAGSRMPHTIRRTSSLPDRLWQSPSAPAGGAQAMPNPTALAVPSAIDDEEEPKEHLSRTSAILLLLVSTGLVAVCAEFLVGSINYMVDSTSVSQAFIGLIILPIVGNAAEHVTAVTVASKNKMDLAIGVAVGSSIQIALFVTPVVVLLGWIMGKEMSLYFSLFETVSLFVSAFIINFLILDGRSNYLEGALLMAAYVIIAVGAYFYPDGDEQSEIGGSDTERKMLAIRGLGALFGF